MNWQVREKKDHGNQIPTAIAVCRCSAGIEPTLIYLNSGK